MSGRKGVYYSYGGDTRRIAELLQKARDADLSGKTVYPFATNGGWLGHTFQDFAKACRGSKVKAGLNVRFNEDKQLTPETDIQSGHL